MTAHSFEQSFQFLKSLESELGNPTMRTTGRPLKPVNPNSAEHLHRMRRGKREVRANEIAEQNMTPNMVIDEKMSRSSEPQHIYQDTRYQDKAVPLEIQVGHIKSDAQRMRYPQEHEMPKPLSFAEVQQMRGSNLQGPLPYEQIRQFPDEPTNPFKVGKSSPFDLAWTILKK